MRGSDRARELRRTQTDAEAKLWWHLRDRRLGGYKFRRQYPVGCYVVDFVCVERRLIVELDGGQHVDRHRYDNARTRWLAKQGYSVTRYWNDDVLMRADEVLSNLLSKLAPHPDPLPARGEREQAGAEPDQ